MPAITCPRCGDDLEYDTETTSDGDGLWMQSGIIGVVSTNPCPPEAPPGCYGQTTCGCAWTWAELEQLDEAATERAAEGPTEW